MKWRSVENQQTWEKLKSDSSSAAVNSTKALSNIFVNSRFVGFRMMQSNSVWLEIPQFLTNGCWHTACPDVETFSKFRTNRSEIFDFQKVLWHWFTVWQWTWIRKLKVNYEISSEISIDQRTFSVASIRRGSCRIRSWDFVSFFITIGVSLSSVRYSWQEFLWIVHSIDWKVIVDNSLNGKEKNPSSWFERRQTVIPSEHPAKVLWERPILWSLQRRERR